MKITIELEKSEQTILAEMAVGTKVLAEGVLIEKDVAGAGRIIFDGAEKRFKSENLENALTLELKF